MMKAFVVQGVDVLGGKVDRDHRDGRAEDVVLLEVPEPVSLRSPTSQDNPQSQAAGSIEGLMMASGELSGTDLTHKQRTWAELAMAVGGFGIGTGEFVIMGLLPEVAERTHVPVT